MKLRTVERTVKAQATSDGAGVRLHRSIGTPMLDHLDPFLLLDEIRSDEAGDYIAGFPDHPHRGFETVTYMLAGRMEHRDHVGNQGNLTAGSVQWMTAGRGIIHSEMHKQEEGLLWGFQLWVNLPAKLKMSPPRPQPKHFHVSRVGVTVNEGVFSPWKGQRPLKVVPAFLSGTVSPMNSTMSSFSLMVAATLTDNLSAPPTSISVRQASPTGDDLFHPRPGFRTHAWPCQVLTRLSIGSLAP